MTSKKALLILFVFAVSVTNAQYLNGKIIADFANLEGITIQNATQKIAITSARNGFFKIKANPNDSLVLSGIQFEGVSIKLKKAAFEKDLFFIHLKLQTNYIQEIVVVKEKNGFEAGVLSKKAKTFTPAERKLNTASNLYPTANIGSMSGGSLGLDPIINWISGRTKRLKQELNVEQKELALDKINYMFDETYFTKILKIPEDKLEGFLYFVVEDAEFKKALNSKNKTMTKFLLVDLSKNYLKLQN